jgi:UPF0242 C-terminal PAS-like domain/Uncharacterised protein family (UPF0242) N-terminus
MNTRQTIYFALLICLMAPVLFVSYFGGIMERREIWAMAFLSLFLGAGGGLYFLQLWEKKMQRSVASLVQTRLEKLQVIEEDVRIAQNYEHNMSLMQACLTKSKEEMEKLQTEMEQKREQMRLAYLEFEDFRMEYRRLEEEIKRIQIEGHQAIENKEALISEYGKTVAEQRLIIEKKQRYIASLEAKVKDQMFEIRSLLQQEGPLKPGPYEALDFTETESFPSFQYKPQTPYDFSIQLHRYIEKAEHLTGVEHLGYMGGKSPRFLDLSLEGYALDRRRLFESFKDETTGVIFIFSLSEMKFLFVSPPVKDMTGWSEEKFMKEFPKLVIKGYPEWQEALGKIKAMKECSLKLLLLSRSQQAKPVDCYMGLIMKGPFAQHVIGILN